MLKKELFVLVSALFLVALLAGNPADAADPADSTDPNTRMAVPEALHGVWENTNRFVEFTENDMRIVLKPYYRFVYEPFPPLPCISLPRSPHVPAEGVHALSLSYPRDKKTYPFTVVRIDDALFLNFLVRLPLPDDEADPGAEIERGADGEIPVPVSGTTNHDTDLPAALDGAWLPAGSVPALRLYPVEPAEDFFIYIFDGDRYFRIRYWKTDARERAFNGRFTGKDGHEYHLPKFIRIDGILYTCITSTGRIIRNFEEGSVGIEDGGLRFDPDRVVFKGSEAAYRHPVPYTLDGDVLAFGEPYLVRSIVTDLDATIAEHNAKRRPPRKPIFEFLKLDFHWDEIARLRGNILDR